MTPTLRWLAVPLALAASLTAIPTRASEIRDGAKMFSDRAISQAEAALSRSSVPVVIETIPSLNGKSIEAEIRARAPRERNAGVYVLIAKEGKLRFEERDRRFTSAQSDAIRDAFLTSFKRGDLDSGLVAGAQAITSAVSSTARRGGVAPAPGRGVPQPNRRGGGLGFLITIGLIILAVIVVMRILGGLFGAGRAGAGYAQRPGMGGYGPGMGGYGPGMGGGGGGGFFSSMLGGIGGAMAGNWMYDRMRGHDSSGGNYGGGADAGSQGPAPDEAGWGGMGGGDWGGGDAGGGDAGGGGGDWGGGGGGDWGGGGGGDWGGGGGGGGDWG